MTKKSYIYINFFLTIEQKSTEILRDNHQHNKY